MKSLFRAMNKNREWEYGTVHIDQTGRACFTSPVGIKNPSDYTLEELHEATSKVDVMLVDWNTLQINMGNKYVPYYINKNANRIGVEYLDECTNTTQK